MRNLFGFSVLTLGLSAVLLANEARAEEPASKATVIPVPAESMIFIAAPAEQAAPPVEAAPPTADAVPAPAAEACKPEEKKKKDDKPKQPKDPYGGVFFENQFEYLLGDEVEKDEYFEKLKAIKCGCDWRFDVGGEYRHQFKNEGNRRTLFAGAITNPRTDTFTLHRVRIFGDVHFKGDWLRGYAEYIDASQEFTQLPPLFIDVNRSDMLNLFGEMRLFKSDDTKVFARVGRQELLFDAQRLVSPLDWANTRRTFNGGRVFSRGKTWDVDAFWARPVSLSPYYTPANFHPESFDQGDQSLWFAGVHGFYKGFENQKAAPYMWILREEDVIPGPVTGTGHRPGSGNPDTLFFTPGVRLNGELDNWVWDWEFAMQLGRTGTQTVLAGMATVSVGKKFPDKFWKPEVYLFYDYASGDSDPTDGVMSTFNQLFPLGHKWFGFIDLQARQNVHDINMQVFVKPTKKMTLLAWPHFLFLADPRDAWYNAAGVAARQDATGNSGQWIGSTVDFLANYNFKPGIDGQLGYSPFFSGTFVQNTGTAANGYGTNAYFLYTQLSIKY